jgi:hypothetical protein
MKKTAAIIVGCFLMFSACADNTSANPATSSEQVTSANVELTEAAPTDLTEEKKAMVPAIIFFQYLNQQAPTLLCEQDPGIACLQMPNELCAASVQASAERCGPKLLAQWPERFEETEENAINFSKAYRSCVLNDWVEEFGLQANRLEACGIELN